MSKHYGYPTTRSFARSTNEAFQQDQGSWWFPPEKTSAERLWLYAAIAFFVSSIFFALSIL